MAASYTIDGGPLGKERLDVLQRVHGPHTQSLLDRVGIGAGARCLDVGCGGGHVARELSHRVGPRGSVLGIDTDPSVVELARVDAATAGLSNVVFHCADASELEPSSTDFAHARFLLSHVAEPQQVVIAMAAAAGPEGVVVVEDTDFRGCFCYPPCGAFDHYVDLYRQTVHRRGGNADLGPALPSLLHGAGLCQIGVATYQVSALEGGAKLLARLTLERIASAVVAEGVADGAEVEHIVAELAAYCARPTTLVGTPRVVQAWGVKH